MSFSHQLKQEILDNRPMRSRCWMAQAYGLFSLSRSFAPDSVEIRTENEETVKLFRWFARKILGETASVTVTDSALRSGGRVYTGTVDRPEQREALLRRFAHGERFNRSLLATQEEAGAFFAGAFLACGNMIDPEKSYHLEYVVRREALRDDLEQLLEEAIPGVRISRRRNHHILYYKEYGPIEDLLTLMGATKSCLQVIEIEMYKSVRNQANRATNCETANIDKQVDAAAAQMEDIRLVLSAVDEEELPTGLRQAAWLRLENPEASLRELVELSAEPISRSGLHHRLDKLGKMARSIREGKGKGRGEGNG